MKKYITFLASLLITFTVLSGCGKSVCEEIVDKQVACDTTGLASAFRGAAVSACEQSDNSNADLEACNDCLEGKSCEEMSECDTVCDFGSGS